MGPGPTNIMQETQAVKEAARIIGISIRTAPKSGGVDDIAYKILTDKQRKEIVLKFKEVISEVQKGRSADIKKALQLDWDSDADAIDNSDCLLIIGVKGAKALGLNCGGCGFKNCAEFARANRPADVHIPGPFCIFKLLDLGIAVSSAVKTAANFNIDSRIMYKAGLASDRLGFMKGYNPILGLPLSASGKNIYFDRKEKLMAKEIWAGINKAR